METLFELPEPKKEICRNCKNLQRWECGSKYINYCGVRGSLRTENGLLKIKTTDPACVLFVNKKK